MRMLRHLAASLMRVRLYNPRTARAQTGAVAQLGGQGFEPRGVYDFGKTPAGVADRAWVGQCTLVAQAA
jgi:hypothetical protein